VEQIDWEKYAYHLLVVSTRYFSSENYEKYLQLRDSYLSSNPQNDVEVKIKEVIQSIEELDKSLIKTLGVSESLLRTCLEKFYDNPVSKKGQDFIQKLSQEVTNSRIQIDTRDMYKIIGLRDIDIVYTKKFLYVTNNLQEFDFEAIKQIANGITNIYAMGDIIFSRVKCLYELTFGQNSTTQQEVDSNSAGQNESKGEVRRWWK